MDPETKNENFDTLTHPACVARRELINIVGDARNLKAMFILIDTRKKIRQEYVTLMKSYENSKNMSNRFAIAMQEVDYHGFSNSETYGIALIHPQCRMTDAMAFTILLIAMRLLEFTDESEMLVLPPRVVPVFGFLDPTADLMRKTMGDFCPQQPKSKNDVSMETASWSMTTMMITHKSMRDTVTRYIDEFRRDPRSFLVPYGILSMKCTTNNTEKGQNSTFFLTYNTEIQNFSMFRTEKEVMEHSIRILQKFLDSVPKKDRKGNFYKKIRMAAKDMFLDRETIPETVYYKFLCEKMFFYYDTNVQVNE